MNDGRRSHKSVILALLNRFADPDSFSVRSVAPRQVELVTFRDGGETLISAVDLLCTDELLPVRSFEIAVRCEKPAEIVRIGGRERKDESVPFIYENGYAHFRCDGLVMFDMWRIR